jgi:hypothetical protein
MKSLIVIESGAVFEKVIKKAVMTPEVEISSTSSTRTLNTLKHKQ